MRIEQHPDSLALLAPAAASTRRISSGQTTETGNLFASLVANTPLASASASNTSGTAATEVAPVNPFASWVTCAQAAVTGSGTAATDVASVNALAALVTATPAATTASTTTSTTSSAAIATPAQPGIAALISAIMDGSFKPTYKTPSQLAENTPFGTIYNSPAYYASDETAQQLATLLGGTVVQKVPFPSSNATTTEIKANFIQLPSGQTVNAADLSYYASFGGYGVQQLAADLTQEINQGGAITDYNDQMLAARSGNGSESAELPSFQPYEIGPAIAGMTYPPGTLAADGSVINPMTQNVTAT